MASQVVTKDASLKIPFCREVSQCVGVGAAGQPDSRAAKKNALRLRCGIPYSAAFKVVFVTEYPNFSSCAIISSLNFLENPFFISATFSMIIILGLIAKQ